MGVNTMNKKFKALTGIVAVMFCLGCLSGCINKSVTSSEVTEIVMWSSNSHSKKVFTEEVGKFNNTIGKENNVKLTYIVKENDLGKQMEIALQTGEAPDFISGKLSTLADNGDIIALEDIEGGQKYVDQYRDQLVEDIHTYKGKTYRISCSVITFGLLYNKDMFKKAGIVDENGEAKPPETIAEMREYAKKLTNKEKKEYGIIFPVKWDAWVSNELEFTAMPSTGSIGYDPTNGTFDFNALKPMLRLALDMKVDGSVYPGAEGTDNDPARARFAEGNIGMKFGVSWDVGVLNDQFPAKCDWGVAPIPVEDPNNKYLQVENYSLAPLISKKAVEEKGADKIMLVYDWFVGNELQSVLYKEGMAIPNSAEIIKNVELNNAPKGWKEFAELHNISTFSPARIATDTSAYDSIEADFINKVWSGEEDLDAFIERRNAISAKGIELYKKNNPEYDPSHLIIPDWYEKVKR